MEPAKESPTRRPRRDPRREATRKRVVEATLALLVEQGSGGLSKAAICRRAGIHPPAFYRYFDSLEDCERAAATSLAQTMIERDNLIGRRHRIARSASVPRTVMQVEEQLRAYLQERDSSWAMVRCRHERSPTGEAIRDALQRATELIMRDMWIDAAAAGVDESRLPQLRAQAELCVDVFFSALAQLLHEPERDVHQVARTISHYMYNAVGARVEELRDEGPVATA